MAQQKFASEQQRRQYAAQAASNINSIEGVPLTNTTKKLLAKWERGEITAAQMEQSIVAQYDKRPEGNLS